MFASGFFFGFTPVFWAWITQTFDQDTSMAFASGFINSVGATSNIWAPIVNSGIFVATGSYGWATFAQSVFSLLTLLPAICLCVSQKQREEYDQIRNEDELISKSTD